jgi:neurotransmitter:Na+ symporter, NSS family
MNLRFGYLLVLTLVLQFLRFPYVFEQGGGGAFLYIYFIVSVMVGGCLLMGEFILGKDTGKSLGASLERFTHDKVMLDTQKLMFKPQGMLALSKSLRVSFILLGLFMCAYFSVICIWLLQSMVHYFTGTAYEIYSHAGSALVYFSSLYFLYKKQNTIWIVNLEKGLLVGVVILIFYMMFDTLSLSKNNAVLMSLFYPDYSQMSWSTLLYALGQSSFALLLGFGLVTQHGATLGRNRDVTSLATRLVSVSFFFGVMSAIVAMSVVHGKSFSLYGSRYFLETLPKIFCESMGDTFLGYLLICVFYGILSLLVCRLLRLYKKDLREKWSAHYKKRSLAFITMFVTLASCIVFVSVRYKHFKILNSWSPFEFADAIFIDVILVLFTVMVGLMVFLTAPKKLLHREFSAIEIEQEISHFYPVWRFCLLWFTPVVVVLAMGLSAIGWFQP